MPNSQILSNILYPIEYSYGSPEVSTIYPTFFIAYFIYSTSHSVSLFTVKSAFSLFSAYQYSSMNTSRIIFSDEENGLYATAPSLSLIHI